MNEYDTWRAREVHSHHLRALTLTLTSKKRMPKKQQK